MHRLIPALYTKITSSQSIDLIQGTHDFIYIIDFVDLVERVINAHKSQTQSNIVNAGTGTCYTNVQVAEIFSRILNMPVIYNSINIYKECDSQLWVCDTRHARAQYGFVARYDLEKGLTAYKHYRELSRN
jgi:UDP-glucose 4-epimerase